MASFFPTNESYEALVTFPQTMWWYIGDGKTLVLDVEAGDFVRMPPEPLSEENAPAVVATVSRCRYGPTPLREAKLGKAPDD